MKIININKGVKGSRLIQEHALRFAYMIQKKQSGSSQEKDFAYIALFPKTGRTHQLRVHLKYIHRPIVCDKLYAPKKPCTLGFERVALHAYKINFKLHGTAHEYTAELPSDFETALNTFKSDE